MPSFKETFDEVVPEVTNEERAYYPGLYLGGKAAEHFSGLSVGDERMMLVKARVKSVSESDHGRGKDHSISMDILEGELQPEPDSAADTLFDGE